MFFLYYFLYFDKFEDLTHLGAKARPLFTYIIYVCVYMCVCMCVCFSFITFKVEPVASFCNITGKLTRYRNSKD